MSDINFYLETIKMECLMVNYDAIDSYIILINLNSEVQIIFLY